MLRPCFAISLCLLLIDAHRAQSEEQSADLILTGGKIVKVDAEFSIAEAIAIRGERIVKVGTAKEVAKLKGDATEVIDLGGKMVVPGLIDSHVHPNGAAMHEFDHEIPDMQTIDNLLN